MAKTKRSVYDTHHLLFTRRSWSKTKTLKALRDYWYMRVEIPTDTLHHLIHRLMPNGVPTPTSTEAGRLLRYLYELESCGEISEDDDILTRLDIIIPFFEGQTRSALKRQYIIASDFYQTYEQHESDRKRKH